MYTSVGFTYELELRKKHFGRMPLVISWLPVRLCYLLAFQQLVYQVSRESIWIAGLSCLIAGLSWLMLVAIAITHPNTMTDEGSNWVLQSINDIKSSTVTSGPNGAIPKQSHFAIGKNHLTNMCGSAQDFLSEAFSNPSTCWHPGGFTSRVERRITTPFYHATRGFTRFWPTELFWWAETLGYFDQIWQIWV